MGLTIRRRRALTIVGAAAVVVIAVLALLIHFGYANQPRVNPGGDAGPPGNASQFNVTVTSIDYRPSTCVANTTSSGTTVPGGSSFRTFVVLSDATSSSCEVVGVTALTMGFAVRGSNTPLVLTPGAETNLNLTIQTPDFEVNQAIVISLTVTLLP